MSPEAVLVVVTALLATGTMLTGLRITALRKRVSDLEARVAQLEQCE